MCVFLRGGNFNKRRLNTPAFLQYYNARFCCFQNKRGIKRSAQHQNGENHALASKAEKETPPRKKLRRRRRLCWRGRKQRRRLLGDDGVLSNAEIEAQIRAQDDKKKSAISSTKSVSKRPPPTKKTRQRRRRRRGKSTPSNTRTVVSSQKRFFKLRKTDAATGCQL